MISLGGKSKLDASEYLKFLKDIESEVQRALKLISYLNRYAHRMDFETSDFSVNEALEELAALVSRLAYLKKITLEREFGPDIPAIHSSPALLQLVVYCLFDDTLKSLSRNGTITLKTEVAPEAVIITVIPKGTPAEAPEKGMCSAEALEQILGSIGATLIRHSGGALLVQLPLTPAAGV
jgi:signal transduction histidine kinase